MYLNEMDKIRNHSDVFYKASMVYLAKVSSRCPMKMTCRFSRKTSFEHWQDVLLVLIDIFKTSCRCLFADWEFLNAEILNLSYT